MKELISNKLIDDALELEFDSYFGTMVKLNPDCYHLWLHDLQRWLRDKYNIDITVITEWKEDKRVYRVGLSYINDDNEVDIWFSNNNPDYSIKNNYHKYLVNYEIFEDALEVGLIKGITLIKK